MTEAIVREIWIYPIKGCQGTAVEAAKLTRLGLPGDRVFTLWRDGALIDQKDTPAVASIGVDWNAEAGRLTLSHPDLGTFEHRALDEGERRPGRWVLDRFETIDQGEDVSRWLSKALGVEVRLVRAAGPWRINFPIPQLERLHEQPKQTFTTASPVSLANRASLDALNAELEAPVPMDRFRMNVVIEGLDAHEEDTVSAFENEAVRLLHVTPAERCVIVTTDQRTGERDAANLLRSLPKKSKQERFGSGRIFGSYLQVEREGVLRVGDRLTTT